MHTLTHPTTPTIRAAWIIRHPIVTFFALTYTISWAFWLSMILFKISAVAGLGAGLFVAGVFGPPLAALIINGATDGKRGIRTLLSAILRWRVGIQWYLVALLGPLVITLAAVWLSSLLGATALPIERFTRLYQLLPTFLVALVLNGPLSEELGWRGYALPRLQQGRCALAASLILGLIWGSWHLPLFWIADAPAAALIEGDAVAALVKSHQMPIFGLFRRAAGTM